MNRAMYHVWWRYISSFRIRNGITRIYLGKQSTKAARSKLLCDRAPERVIQTKQHGTRRGPAGGCSVASPSGLRRLHIVRHIVRHRMIQLQRRGRYQWSLTFCLGVQSGSIAAFDLEVEFVMEMLLERAEQDCSHYLTGPLFG